MFAWRSSLLLFVAAALTGCFTDAGDQGGGPGSASDATSDATSTTADATTQDNTSTSTAAGTSTTDAATSAPTTAASSTSASTTADGTTGSTSLPDTTTGDTGTTGAASCGDGVVSPDEECDDGNLEAGDGCSPECTIENGKRQRLAFLSSAPIPASFGGLDKADFYCNELAAAAALPGTFRAWLSDAESGPATRFTPVNGPYVRTDGIPIALSWNDLTSGAPLLAPLSVDETGKVYGGEASCQQGHRVWTATSTAGHPLGAHCMAWTSAQTLNAGSVGLSVTTDKWTESGCTVPCSALGRLYCFEQ